MCEKNSGRHSSTVLYVSTVNSLDVSQEVEGLCVRWGAHCTMCVCMCLRMYMCVFTLSSWVSDLGFEFRVSDFGEMG